MASHTMPSVADRWPVGTTVEAFEVNAHDARVGSVVATAVVASSGSLAFTGLTAGTRYQAFADDVGVFFRTANPDPAESRLAAIEANAEAVASSYRLLAPRLGTIAQNTTASGARVLRPSGQVVIPSQAQAANGIVHLRAGQYTPPAGKDLVLMLAVALYTNDVAPAATLTFALAPVTAVGGANGINSVTLGAAVADSDAAFATPAAALPFYEESSDFTPPADGDYVVTVTNDAQTAANSDLSFGCSLLWRWVDA